MLHRFFSDAISCSTSYSIIIYHYHLYSATLNNNRISTFFSPKLSRIQYEEWRGHILKWHVLFCRITSGNGKNYMKALVENGRRISALFILCEEFSIMYPLQDGIFIGASWRIDGAEWSKKCGVMLGVQWLSFWRI